MFRSVLSRAVAVAGAASLAVVPVAFAPPAQAFTTRVETVNRDAGYGVDDTVTLASSRVAVAAGSTLRVARPVGYTQFTRLVLTQADGFERVLWTARRVPGTTTAWDVPLTAVGAGTYGARLEADDGEVLPGKNRVAYLFTLAVAGGPAASVKLPLAGTVDRRVNGGAWTSWVRAGDRITYVAPPGVSFRDAAVRMGTGGGYNGQYLDQLVTQDLAVTRVTSGRSLQLRVPTDAPPDGPFLTRRMLTIEITLPAAPTAHGTGRVVLQGDLMIDPPDTPWSAPTAVEGVTDHLADGYSLSRGRSLVSRNGRYRLAMQQNSNLVLWKGSRAIWQTGQKGAAWVELNGDGNLIQRDGSGAIVWQTAKYGGRGEALLVVRDDGDLVVQDRTGRAIWATNTAGR